MSVEESAQVSALRAQVTRLETAHKALKSDVDRYRKRVGELESRTRKDAEELFGSLGRGLPLTAASAALVVLLTVPWLGMNGDYDGHDAVMSGWATIGEAFDGKVAVLGLLVRLAIIGSAFLGVACAVAADSVGLRWTTTVIAALTAIGVIVVLASFSEWSSWDAAAGGVFTIGCLALVAALAAPVDDRG